MRRCIRFVAVVVPLAFACARSPGSVGAGTASTGTASTSSPSAVAGMPAAWSAPQAGSGAVPQDYEVGVDQTVKHGGRSSAYIKSTAATPRGFMALTQGFRADAYRGKRVRLSGYVRTRDVADTAGLWMQVQAGGGATAFDNMEKRPIRGTTDWTRHEVVLDVPPNAAGIAFGFLLQRRGRAWVDDLRFDVAGNDVASTNLMPAPRVDSTQVEAQAKMWASSPTEPANLDFEITKP